MTQRRLSFKGIRCDADHRACQPLLLLLSGCGGDRRGREDQAHDTEECDIGRGQRRLSDTTSAGVIRSRTPAWIQNSTKEHGRRADARRTRRLTWP